MESACKTRISRRQEMIRKFLKNNCMMLCAIIVYFVLCFVDGQILAASAFILMVAQVLFWIRKKLTHHVRTNFYLLVSTLFIFLLQDKGVSGEGFPYFVIAFCFLFFQFFVWLVIGIQKLLIYFKQHPK